MKLRLLFKLRRSRRIGMLAGLIALAFGAGTATGSTIAYTASGGFASIATTTWGIEFTSSVGITIDALGMFDDQSDGLFVQHDVGLWDLSGNLLASATLPSGTSAPLVNGFRFVNITPLTLNAGTYRVGVSLLDDVPSNAFRDAALSNAILSPSPGITLTSGTFTTGSVNPTLSFPNVLSDAAPSAAANFNFTPVPEPATLALFGLGLAGVGAMRRRRRKT